MKENPTTTPESAQINCPNCQTALTYYDVTGSSFYACPYCYTFFKHENEDSPVILNMFHEQQAVYPTLALGTEGTLEGTTYRVVGFMKKTEADSSAKWSEYVLFSRAVGHAQLADYNGHWQFIRRAEKQQYIPVGESRIYDGDDPYDLYHTYQPKLLYAEGEFDWNIQDDDSLTIREFVAPPRMLVEEDAGTGTPVWYQAQHLAPETIAKAFGLAPADLPVQFGVGAIEPAPGRNTWDRLVSLTMLACLTVLFITILLNGCRSSPILLDDTFFSERDTASAAALTASPPLREYRSKSFTVDGPTALSIDFQAPLNNQWLELAVSLENEETNRSYTFTKVIEYYYGFDWSEGSRKEDAVLSRIPSGRYHLSIQPYAESVMPASVRVRVEQNSTLQSNVLLTLAILLIYPIIQFFRQQEVERRRWADSDFSGQEEEEDS